MIPASTVHFRIPPRLNLLIARGRRAPDLKLLDKIIGSDYGLFREDAEILQDRQAALHFKIDLLLEWNRHSEALAWLCLLKSAAGETRVHLRAVQLVSIPPDQVEISSYEPVV